jgi:hypothetical protein
MLVKFKLYQFIDDLSFCTKFKNRRTNQHKCIIKFDFRNFEMRVLNMSLAPPQQNFKYLGNDESTNVGNKCTNQHKRMTEF